MSWLSHGDHGKQCCSWVHMHDNSGGVMQNGGYTSNNRLTKTCSLGLPCTFLIYDIMLWSIDTCQIRLSAEHYHVTISQAQFYSSSKSRVLLKLTADQVLVFDWIAGSCQVNLLKAELGWKVNQIKTDSSLQLFFVYSLNSCIGFYDF